MAQDSQQEPLRSKSWDNWQIRIGRVALWFGEFTKMRCDSPGSRIPIMAMLLLTVGACAAPDVLPKGDLAYKNFPQEPAEPALEEYQIGPLDTLAVRVFNEPQLSVDRVQVTTGGTISLPLIGDIKAAGRTSAELTQELTQRLGRDYLYNPQVTVTIVASVSQKVTVEGLVAQPGVYDIDGRTTLLKAIALARSPTKLAANDEVAIFRTIDGKRMGALFNLNEIRRGRAPDPQIRGNDVVVVGLSTLKGTYRDFLTALPSFGVFAAFQ